MFVRRFIREGQILAQLCQNAHPGIVRISDLFEEKGLHCLVMDLVIGQSLLDWVKYSQGRFGFSVQKKIWLEVGGKVEAR